MLYFLIRVLVNSLALAVTFGLLPGIHITPYRQEPLAITYLTLGFLMASIIAIVWPIFILLTARVVLWTLGLFIFIFNIVLLLVLAAVAPRVITFSEPALLWLIVGSLAVSLILTILQAVFGLGSPMVNRKIHSRSYWRWLSKLPTGRRNPFIENLRVYFILSTLISYLEDVAIGVTPLSRFRVFMQRLIYDDQDMVTDEPLPAKIRILLQDLGPTFVKFGQVVSSRAAELPAPWATELARLQSNVPPFPYEETRRIIVDELGQPPEQLYASFDQKPFAAASTAQVHKATLQDGRLVVVKVQRPDIDITVKADLNVMRDLAGILEQRQEAVREMDVRGLVNEFADNVMLELNYENELFNAQQLAMNMREMPCIHVPAMFPELSAKRVMTQEFVKGVKITAVEKLDAAGVNRQELARDFLHAMIKQVLFDGFFHADPHPGNILVDLRTSRIIFLDMGMMGYLTRDQRFSLADMIWSLHERDGRSLANIVMHLSLRMRDVDEGAFADQVERLMKRYLSQSNEQMNLSEPLQAMLAVMRREGLRLDPSLTLALKAMFQAEETVRVLDPKLPLVAVAFEELKVLFRDQLNSDNVMHMVRSETIKTAKEVVRRIPSLAGATLKWMDQIERGKLSVHVDTSDIGKEVDKLDSVLMRSVTLLALAMLLAGLLIGSAIASTLQLVIGGINLANIAFFLFLGGAGITTLLVLRIAMNVWRSWPAATKGGKS